jgi:hypothetical protein
MYSSGSNCYCNSGYTMNNYGQCVLAICGSNMYRSGSYCYCDNGYMMNSAGRCVRMY